MKKKNNKINAKQLREKFKINKILIYIEKLTKLND